MSRRLELPAALALLFLVYVHSHPVEAGPARGAEPEIDPNADALLRRMSAYLAVQTSFDVRTRSATDVLLDGGQKVKIHATSEVTVTRPDRLRIDRAADLSDAELYYDGKTITVYGRRKGVYAADAAPPTLDEAIRHMQDRLGVDAGPADLFTSRPYQVLMEDVVSARDLGRSVLDGVPTRHLAFRGREVDFELWITDGDQPLPKKYVITSKKMDGAPQFEVTFEGWDLDEGHSDATFRFEPPESAERIEFTTALAKRKQKP